MNVIYALSVLINTVLYSYPIIQKIDELMKKRKNYFKIESRFFIFIIQALLAYLIPSIGSVMNILGYIFTVFLGFILPMLLFLKHNDYRYDKG